MFDLRILRAWTYLLLCMVTMDAHTATYVYVSCALSQSIMVSELDMASGELSHRQTVEVGGTVMPLAVSPDRKFIFAALRSKPYGVAVFAIDPTDGRLHSSGGFPLPESMASIATDQSGQLLLAASYGGNMLSVSRISPSGQVLTPHQIVPTPPMAHNLRTTLDNRYAFATSLGGDVLLQFRLDSDKKILLSNVPAQMKLPAKAGPRHLVFHPRGRFAFVLGELDAKVRSYTIDETGLLAEASVSESLPYGFLGAPAAADIHLTPDGRFLYTSDRGSHTLAGFQVNEHTGQLRSLGHWSSEEQPRGFNIDPSGRFLIEAGQRSGMLSVHRIQTDGMLQRLWRFPAGQGPNWVEIISFPP